VQLLQHRRTTVRLRQSPGKEGGGGAMRMWHSKATRTSDPRNALLVSCVTRRRNVLIALTAPSLPKDQDGSPAPIDPTAIQRCAPSISRAKEEAVQPGRRNASLTPIPHSPSSRN
jgi:hypothetical protein